MFSVGKSVQWTEEGLRIHPGTRVYFDLTHNHVASLCHEIFRLLDTCKCGDCAFIMTHLLPAHASLLYTNSHDLSMLCCYVRSLTVTCLPSSSSLSGIVSQQSSAGRVSTRPQRSTNMGTALRKQPPSGRCCVPSRLPRVQQHVQQWTGTNDASL